MFRGKCLKTWCSVLIVKCNVYRAAAFSNGSKCRKIWTFDRWSAQDPLSWPQSDAAAWSRRLWSNTNDKGEGNGFFWASSAFPDDRRAQCGGAGRLEGVSDGERQAGALRSNQVSPKSIMDQLLVLVMIQAVTAVGIGDDPSCHSCW